MKLSHYISILLFSFAVSVPLESSAWTQVYTCDNVTVSCGDNTPMPIYWEKPCIAMHINEAGTVQMPFEEVESIVQESLAAWTRPEVSSLRLRVAGLTDETRIGYNPYTDQNANIIVFRDKDWEESKSIMALTSVTQHNVTGIIYDADIEINSTDYRFGNVDTDGGHVVDLQNTLTHEIGHVFGLGHSPVIGATMSVYANYGETDLRTLEDDDLQAIASMYPPQKDGIVCDLREYYFHAPSFGMNEHPPEDCSARVAGGSTECGTAAAIFLAIGVLGIVRRRKRQVASS